MKTLQTLQEKRQAVLEQIQAIGSMRTGSVCQQFVKSKGNPGKKNGPYTIFTRKVKGKTVTRSLQPQDAEMYRRQTENHNRYLELMAEYAKISEQMAEIETRGFEAGKKNNRGG